MPRLSIMNASISYGDAIAVAGADIRVEEGEMVAAIGANGAGKTSLLRAVSGLADVTEGAIAFGSQNLRRVSAWDLVSLGIVHVPEGRRLFKQMTVEENLLVGGFRRSKSDNISTLFHVYDLFPKLKERRFQYAGTMSGGEQQMVAIGRGLMAQPKVLLLDEPSLGLAPKIVELVFSKIVEINRTGVAILLVEQNAVLALEVTSRAYLMENGRVVKNGLSSDLLTDDAVREAYLGM